MWKIIKAELTYTHPLVFAIYVFFMFIIIYNSLTINNGSLYHTGIIYSIALQIIPTCFVIKLIETWNYEIRETRLRKLATLPVPSWHIGISRLLVYAILLMFLIVFGIFFLVLLARASNFEIYIEHDLAFLYGWIPIAFGLRLLTEKYGRILFWPLIAFVYACIFSIGSTIPSPPCCEKLAEFTFSPLGAIITTIIFCAVIQVSFMNRKSYLK